MISSTAVMAAMAARIVVGFIVVVVIIIIIATVIRLYSSEPTLAASLNIILSSNRDISAQNEHES